MLGVRQPIGVQRIHRVGALIGVQGIHGAYTGNGIQGILGGTGNALGVCR
jgi:hypothetical protein